MKRWFLLIVFLLLLGLVLVLPTWAKDKEVILTWTQVLPVPNDLKGWTIYWSETPGGPHKELTFVQFAGVQETYRYEGGKVVGKVGKKKAKVYFVLRAVDAEGNVSPLSPEVTVQMDTTPTNDTTPPVAPGNVEASKK